MKSDNQNLEPRVAQVEAGLGRLTEDMRELAGIVRTQGQQVESEIQKLVVAVTQASGPRKTDWSMLISLAFLIMALGSAVFWPLNQTAENNKNEIKDLQIKVEDHTMADRQMVLQQVDTQTIEKVVKLEAWQKDQDSRALDELQRWRDKFQGLETK